MAPITHTSRHLLVAAGLVGASFGAQALSVTIPTSLIDAEAVFSFNADTTDLMSSMGVGVSALGNTRQLAGAGWNFMMPVTQVTLNASIFPIGLNPESGFATGSGLFIKSETGGLSLANFGLDFKRNVLTADLATAQGTKKTFDVFAFNVAENLHLSTSGGLSMKMNLTDMMLTTGAQTQFASALQLEEYAVAVLPMLNFGSLSVDISPMLRLGVSDKSLTAPVPELPPLAMLALGLGGIAFVSRRRLSMQER